MEVKADHQSTMRVSTRRGPILSPRTPLGISNAAYANVKIPLTQPQATGPMWSES
jgi:hypothetical protein